ncbi:MAG: AAA domain-containing protein [Azospirillum sp.]|nr:AAA domain-containing protein [Azospirillum sp.]
MNPADAVRERAFQAVFQHLLEICEGAVAVDAQTRIVWMDDKYRTLLGIDPQHELIGRNIEEIIPSSLLFQVIESGKPMLLDLMPFGGRTFVVSRIPLRDDRGGVIGAIGFVLYDRPQYLKPLVQKFTRLQTDLETAQRELAGARAAKYSLAQFLGTSEPVRDVKRMARRAAQIESTVLLLGETGTGKELIAHAIHAASPRASRPMVAINVAAIPETLTEAEFFGVAPGAYTGAERRGRPGKFEIANGGTLFLDEIGDMPLPLQAKLLRVLQEREIEPLGSNKVIKVDVRIIAATSHDLEDLVARKQFRADLYYRLNVVAITLPPLRRRLADLESIAESILERLCQKYGTPVRELAPSAVAALTSHNWPGNVRELYNVLERACALSDHGILTDQDIVAVLPAAAAAPAAGTPAASVSKAETLADAVAAAERRAIAAALAESHGVKAEAARLLGISRATLYDKLEALGPASGQPT